MAGQAADLLFTNLENGVISDWVNSGDSTAREELWRLLQVILQLKVTLRDAAAMKRLTERAQERRIYQS
jgi:hypothetical protein